MTVTTRSEGHRLAKFYAKSHISNFGPLWPDKENVLIREMLMRLREQTVDEVKGDLTVCTVGVVLIATACEFNRALQ